MVGRNAVGLAGIQKARFFLERLIDVEKGEPFDQVAAEAYLEAAIQFGKNAHYLIVKEVPKDETKHWHDPICGFVSRLRDIIVHEDGSAEVMVKTGVTVFLSGAAIGVSGGTAIATVIPSNPNLRQRLLMRWQAHTDKIRARRLQREEQERMKQLRARLEEEAAERARNLPAPIRTTKVHFVVKEPPELVAIAARHPEIEAWPASGVVSYYLDVLEQDLAELMHQLPNAE